MNAFTRLITLGTLAGPSPRAHRAVEQAIRGDAGNFLPRRELGLTCRFGGPAARLVALAG